MATRFIGCESVIRLLGLTALALAAAVHCARAADPQPYTVVLADTGHGDLNATLKGSSQLVALRDKVPVPPFALIERARSDIERFRTVLESFGYYEARIDVSIAKHALEDTDLTSVLDAVPDKTSVEVRVSIATGPLYRLGRVDIEGAVPESARKALTLKTGDPAVAAQVLDAQAKLLDALEEDGYAFAKADAPDAVADSAAKVLNVTYKVELGPKVRIGDIAFKGLKDVNESFARHALTIKPGDPYKPSKIEAAREKLVSYGVFSGASVRAADHADSDGRVPLTFDVQERKRHAVTIAGAYSTDLGITVSTTWSHRNLFGNAEQINLTAAGTGLGTSTAGLGYNLSAQFLKPLFLEQDQTLEFDVAGIKQDLDAYDQQAQTLAGFLRRKFSDLWSGSAGLSITHDQVAQEGTDRLYQLLSLPVTVAYDSTGVTDPLLDVRQGMRASFAVTPVKSFGASNPIFVILQTSASGYFDFGTNGRTVLALRALAGSLLGASTFDVPPDQRLYAGGSATVRGYAYQSIGPKFADGTPAGATSVDAATIEFRQRIADEWGVAAFVDAGQASDTATPFNGQVRTGAGLGVRYYTPIGAVRLDGAIPLSRGPGTDAFEIYIGLGQAF